MGENNADVRNNLKEGEYLVWLDPEYDEEGELDLVGGFYSSRIGINDFIYNRGSLENALIFDREGAMELLIEAREYGYCAKAIPPIKVEF